MIMEDAPLDHEVLAGVKAQISRNVEGLINVSWSVSNVCFLSLPDLNHIDQHSEPARCGPHSALDALE